MDLSRTQIAAILFAAHMVTSMVAFAELRGGPGSDTNESPIETTEAESPGEQESGAVGSDDDGSTDKPETGSSAESDDDGPLDKTDTDSPDESDDASMGGSGAQSDDTGDPWWKQSDYWDPRDGSGSSSTTDLALFDVAVPDLEANTSIEATANATERFDAIGFENDSTDVNGSTSTATTTADTNGTETDEAVPQAANDAVMAINASFQQYRLVDYADDREFFEHHAAAQRSLAALSETVDDEQAIVEAISEELYAAANRSARLTVADANSVAGSHERSLDSDGQIPTVNNKLGAAATALEAAENETTVNGTQSIGPADRAEAVDHLAAAWNDSEAALDTVEGSTEPTLSLSQKQALERNGSTVVPLQVSLRDVRSYAYEPNVTIEGDADADNLSLIGSESADTTVNGITAIETADNGTVTATVTATAAHDADRSVKTSHEIEINSDEIAIDRPTPGEYVEVETANESTGVSVDVEGDGLHETDISVTDETPDTDDEYRAGPMVRITNDTTFDEATVEIPVDEDDLERADRDEGGNLSIMTWDPRDGEPWTPVETEFDHEEGVASADVDGFSFFSVFWIEDWEDETSDTIVLEDNTSDDDDDAEEEIERSDFVFVIDVSGSMSGSRIVNARDAAQRFVGEFLPDEQGGLVSFATGSTLENELTTDHEQLNESIEELEASGWTNTGSGLRTGIEELEENGWENRSKNMILLADGETNRGDDPVEIAEDAADKGIDISTVGLGSSIDENELRTIAGAANGDYYQVEDSDDLPSTFDRVAANETNANLTDTNGDGIPDRVAEMNLTMPSGSEIVGEPLELDPIALDTSGDGVLDNETVDIDHRVYEEDGKTKLTAQVTYAEHHPNRIDTTGDGLSDAKQVEGWDIGIIDDPHDAQNLLDPETDVDVMDVLTTERAHALPLVDDTTRNGLSDAKERDLGTDPERVTTVDDGFSDAEAFDDPNEDPTLYSTSPPDVTYVNYHSWSETGSVETSGGLDPRTWSVDVDAPSWNFQYTVRIEDPDGVAEYEITRGSRDVGEDTLPNEPSSVLRTESLNSLSEGALSSLRGSQAHAETTDGHGNTGSERIHAETSLYGDVIGQELDPHAGGILSGFTHGASELGDLVDLIFRERLSVLSDLYEFLAAVDSELLKQLIPLMIENMQQQQELDNPFGEDTEPDDHGEYASGWYQGYGIHFLASTLYGGQLSKGISEVTGLSDRLATAKNRVGDVSFARGKTAKPTEVVRQDRLQKQQSIDSSVAREVTRDRQTASTAAQSLDRLNRLSETKRTELAGDGLGEFMTRHGEQGVDVLRQIDDVDAARKVLSVDDATLHRVMTGADDPAVRANILTELDELGIRQANHYSYADMAARHGDDFRTFARTHGDDGVAVMDRITRSSDAQRVLSEHPQVRTDLVQLYKTNPADARQAIDVYNTRAQRVGVRLGDDAPIEPLVNVAQQGDITALDVVVTRGDRIMWTQSLPDRGFPNHWDIGDKVDFTTDVLQYGDKVSDANEIRTSADVQELGYDDVEGNEVVITTDEEGELIDIEIND